ncbi:Crp/Fnr family transcriptional regulator [Magnetofaba australis]|uniref:Putative CRP/FNR family transcriptional regulator n=1 Tax=Magnetofaba australis IT-1 TaxID=1434232 RepID=A0A1Y2K5P9_9PROT|nr:Crp/Fnr family transcriptional regulator [Magnetofaba australis]OSM02325.1 putative CRP/FNR family transcriptional regulator [Magnetofaba australis IT-1]
MVTIEDLGRINLLKDVRPQALERIAGFSQLRTYSPGERILSAADSAFERDLYLLLNGEVSVVKIVLPPLQVGQVDIDAIQSQVYGEIGWLMDRSPTAELFSKSNTVFIQVNGRRLKQLCAQDTHTGHLIMMRLAILLARRTDNLTELMAVTEIAKQQRDNMKDFI